ncbi:MAG TPA: DinB family protein [Pyrinomonadaceae bacterium]|nr:DinB family protein [Pyrinomonadaceae bacterium]
MLNYTTIAEAYNANDRIRQTFKNMTAALTDEQASMRENGEGWTVAEIVEHVTIVESGIAMICDRLLTAGAAKGGKSLGEAIVSGEFVEKAMASQNVKLAAPDIVQPTGTRSIADSLAALEKSGETLDGLRERFETIDCAEFTFPHPAFGPLTAHDWLALIGGHAVRHMGQIKRIVG